jgi:hypothetical protein
VHWPNGSLKVNLRYRGTFGGYYSLAGANSDYNINIGKTKPNTDYTLRIRKLYNGNKSIVGEVKDDTKWVTVVATPASVFQAKANCVRIGKFDSHGNAVDYSFAGQIGRSTIRDFKIS